MPHVSHPVATAQYDNFAGADDYLHEFSSHPWHVETWWFSFFAPERRLGGWLYGLMRPNQGSSNGGLWVWDASTVEPRRSPYFAHYTALPTRLDRVTEEPVNFPSSLRIEVVTSGRRYGLHYADEAAGVRVDLDFTACMPAVGFKREAPPFSASAHFDQAGRVTGTLELPGESVPIDCFAVRDRSWGLRSERVSPRFSYLWMASADESMLVFGERDAAGSPRLSVTRGFLHREGVTRPIVNGTRIEERDPSHHWVTVTHITAVDDLGRKIDMSGRALSRIVHPRPISTNTISLLEFDQQGRKVWGEDQDVWSHVDWKAAVSAWRKSGW